MCCPQSFEDLEDLEAMPETEEQDEKRTQKRTQQMQGTLRNAFAFQRELSFKDMARSLDRKQVTAKFYTLLVLKKHQASLVLSVSYKTSIVHESSRTQTITNFVSNKKHLVDCLNFESYFI